MWAPRYNLSGNELYLLKNMKRDWPRRFRRLTRTWKGIEARILKLIAQENVSQKELWISLFIKGQEFFGGQYVEHGRPFHYLVNKLIENESGLTGVERVILDDVKVFKNRLLRKSDMSHARLKTELYAVAYFYAQGSCSLRDEVRNYFLRKDEKFIKSLPGHEGGERLKWRIATPIKFAPILDRVVDRHVFSKFRFLSIN